jgi:PIN domain nuclease of toxin-antitoxin system
VVDASAILAYHLNEPGTEVVGELLLNEPKCSMSTVNHSEVVARLAGLGWDESSIRESMAAIPLTIVPFDEEDAYACGLLRPITRSAGLSLGDRACIALAMRLKLPVVTMDHAWANLDLPVTVVVARP